MARPPKNGGPYGRQPVYSDAILDEICARLASGEGLRAICSSDPRFPSDTAVKKWVLKYPHTVGAKFNAARDMGFDSIAEQIIEISDESILFDGVPDNALVQQARLRSDNRKWFLSKLCRRYADKVTQEITGDPNAPLVTRIELVPVAPTPRLTALTKVEQTHARGSVASSIATDIAVRHLPKR